MVVYFIQSGVDGPVKIGSTRSRRTVWARLESLQTANPHQLSLLAVTEELLEVELHDRFEAIRMHGEWFSPAPELMSLIDSIATASSIPGRPLRYCRETSEEKRQLREKLASHREERQRYQRRPLWTKSEATRLGIEFAERFLKKG